MVKPTSVFSINTKIVETRNGAEPWALLLGDKDKGNEVKAWALGHKGIGLFSLCKALLSGTFCTTT